MDNASKTLKMFAFGVTIPVIFCFFFQSISKQVGGRIKRYAQKRFHLS